MNTTAIEIGTRKLQKIGGAHLMTIPSAAVKMMKLEVGDMLTCYLDGSELIVRKAG